MRAVTVAVDCLNDAVLSQAETRYALETLLTIAGLPWRHVSPRAGEPVDILYATEPKRPCGVSIEACRGERSFSPDAVTDEDRLWLRFSSRQPRRRILSATEQKLAIRNDIVLTTWWLLTGQQETGASRDRFDRHYLDDVFTYRQRLLHRPLVDEYAGLLSAHFAESHQPCPPWPPPSRCALALSHDVDYPVMVRPLEMARLIFERDRRLSWQSACKVLNGRESFWHFASWMALEAKRQLKSAFYFCGYPGTLVRYLVRAPDPFYDVAQPAFRRAMQEITDRGFEVGVHASYLAYQSERQMAWEKERVEAAAGRLVTGNRHHYWHMDPEAPWRTLRTHGDIGLEYDTSLAFDRRCGFRRGVCSPFHPFDPEANAPVAALQLPPAVMDDHFFQHKDVSYLGDYRSEVDALVDAVRRNRGLLMADYHVRVFNETFFPGWLDTYRYLLQRVQECGDFWCDTPANIARHWLEREDKIRSASADESRRSH